MEYTIPGYKTLTLKHLVMDYNGTLAVDGKLITGVRQCLDRLAENLDIHVITADTFGKVAAEMKDISCTVMILPAQSQDLGKLDYIKHLGPENTVCIGNGRNDRLMLKAAALGIAVILGEGAFSETLQASDVVCTSIVSALELLLNPLRLTATLRS
jgi:soluble P-type ATPase